MLNFEFSMWLVVVYILRRLEAGLAPTTGFVLGRTGRTGQGGPAMRMRTCAVNVNKTQIFCQVSNFTILNYKIPICPTTYQMFLYMLEGIKRTK